MSAEASYSPQPLGLPSCWVVGKKPIGPIVVTYDGPSLVGATAVLSFTGGLANLNATFEDISDVDNPNRWVITIPRFTPTEPNTVDKKVKYLFVITYANGEKLPLYYGTWQLKVLEL